MPIPEVSKSFGYQQIVGLVAATSLTVPTTQVGGEKNYSPALALIRTESQPVRWRDDGTDPTTTVGMILNVGDILKYDGNLSKIRLIQTAATATLNVTYYS